MVAEQRCSRHGHSSGNRHLPEGAAQQPPNTDALPDPSSRLPVEGHVEDTCTPVQGMPQSLNLNMRKQLDNSDRVFHRTVARLFKNICARKVKWEGRSKVRD